MTCVVDTNVLSDLLANVELVAHNFVSTIERDEIVYLCQPVLYELRRGLFRRKAEVKYRAFNQNILPRLTLIPLEDADWLQAAQFWADAVSRGKQLADIDLLLAALAQRLDATLVTADDDFDILPIQRANWRIAQPS
ncbi:MAG: PIN domain-containing protein [Anaerolineae bacterium]|nr:PIN domain-containing protein [Anaerolineae bacterium]